MVDAQQQQCGGMTQTEVIRGLSYQLEVIKQLEHVSWNQVQELKQSLLEAHAALRYTRAQLKEQTKQTQILTAYILEDLTMNPKLVVCRPAGLGLDDAAGNDGGIGDAAPTSDTAAANDEHHHHNNSTDDKSHGSTMILMNSNRHPPGTSPAKRSSATLTAPTDLSTQDLLTFEDE
jgi:hypothetical protein